jgi:uncharacterized surface protein with fasciclin (FAS1) repeats
MKTNLLTLALISACALAACSPSADTETETAAPLTDASMEMAEPAPAASSNPSVGGAAMYADRDIVDNAVNSPEHTTLVAAVQAAGLVETLKGPGPFTVFAPVNAAFAALPAGTVEGLLAPEKKDDLTGLLTYHVVAGKLDATTLAAQIQAGNGSTTLTTVAGGTLTVKADADGVTVTDANGNVANVTVADVMQSNGVIHVIDKVLMP